jgi:hypothetical protein
MKNTALFRTIVQVPPLPSRMSLGSRILCAGSCFAETIGEKLAGFHFNACVNPSGALFNPASLAAMLCKLDTGELYTESDLFFEGGLWRSWDHHGRFSAASAAECLSVINTALTRGADAVLNCDVLIFTFGTAFVYRLRENGHVVANCHKQSQDLFTRELLSIQGIVQEYFGVFKRIFEQRPSIQCVVTISPVRHLREDPHENFISKSTLACAVHELQKAFPKIYYFPAYEIMMDDLRDYRFYEADMAHPNKTAREYIWERFVESCMDETAQRFIEDFGPVQSAMRHTVMQGGEGAQKFGRAMLENVGELETKYPGISLARERDYFSTLCSN